MSGFTGLK